MINDKKIKLGDLMKCKTGHFAITKNKLYLCLKIKKIYDYCEKSYKNRYFIINDIGKIDFWHDVFEKVN